jgi:hypothetical protein
MKYYVGGNMAFLEIISWELLRGKHVEIKFPCEIRNVIIRVGIHRFRDYLSFHIRG